MARYNEMLVGRFARSVQKLFAVKGEVPVASLAGEVTVTHNFFSGRENRFLEQWAQFGARIQTAAVAAQDSAARLVNPAGSNIIAVIESLKVASSVAASELVVEYSNVAQANLTTVVGNANFDKRTQPADAGANGATCILSGSNTVAQIGVIFDDIIIPGIQTSAELITNADQEINLLPGSALQVRSLTLNLSLTVTVRWRERFLEDSERA